MLKRLKATLQRVELHKSNMSKQNFLSALAFFLYQTQNTLLPSTPLLSMARKELALKPVLLIHKSLY
jgi:hypothetical protein